MAFRLRRGVPVAEGLEHLIKKQLRLAESALTRSGAKPEAVHKARTCVKKARAILRLFEKKLGDNFDSSNRRLRKAGRLLSELRDVDAMVDTVQRLHGRYPSLLSKAATDAAAGALGGRKQRALSSAAKHVSQAARQLQHVRRRTPHRIRHVGVKPALKQGALDGYRRGRDAMRGLTLTSDAASFHKWRRRVKDHWYQVRLLEGFDRQAGTRAAGLEELETHLGDEHNLVVLRLRLLDTQHRDLEARTATLILGCIAKYQAWLRRRAMKLGRGLFASSPKSMSRVVDGWIDSA
jgi:CHAD domain-containing protein